MNHPFPATCPPKNSAVKRLNFVTSTQGQNKKPKMEISSTHTSTSSSTSGIQSDCEPNRVNTMFEPNTGILKHLKHNDLFEITSGYAASLTDGNAGRTLSDMVRDHYLKAAKGRKMVDILPKKFTERTTKISRRGFK